MIQFWIGGLFKLGLYYGIYEYLALYIFLLLDTLYLSTYHSVVLIAISFCGGLLSENRGISNIVIVSSSLGSIGI